MTQKIPLSNMPDKFALVDDEDYEFLSQWTWYGNVGGNGHIRASRMRNEKGKTKTYLMHRVILDAPAHLLVDHANRDSLDNRRCNLRLCTRSQNVANQKRINSTTKEKKGSKYKGVIFDPRYKNKPWRTYITYERRRIYVGGYETEMDAAKAYDQKAIELFGAFARPNFSAVKEAERRD